MNRLARLALALLLVSPVLLEAQTQTTFTGNLSSIGTPGSDLLQVRLSLVNCGNANPVIPGVTTPIGNQITLTANSSGLVSSPIWGNTVIQCNGAASTVYQVTYLRNYVVTGVPAYYRVDNAVPFSLNTAVPLTVLPPVGSVYAGYNCTGITVMTGITSGFQPVCTVLTSTPLSDAALQASTSAILGDQQNTWNLILPNGHAGTNGKTGQYLNTFNVTEYGSGLDLGNYGGWSVSKILNTGYSTVSSRGIWQTMSSFVSKHAVGDSMGFYIYLYSDGGSTASSDEAIKIGALNGGETSSYYHGTITATTGLGDTLPGLTQTGPTTDGGILIDISQGTINGLATAGASTFNGTYLGQFPTDQTLPLLTTLGTCSTAIAWNNLVQTPTPVTCAMTLTPINGVTTGFQAGQLACVTGPNYPEQALIASVGAVSGSTQTITINMRNPQDAGAIITQGPLCGSFLSGDADVNFATAGSGFRSAYDIAGSIDGVNLIYAFRSFGHVNGAAPPFRVGGNPFNLTVAGQNGFHIYPGAEIIANNSTLANPKLEPNSVNWTVGDIIEGPHATAVNTAGLGITVQQYTPTNGAGSTGQSIQMLGQGIAGNYAGLKLANRNPCAWYSACLGTTGTPGILAAPDAYLATGTFNRGVVFDAIPAAGAMYFQNCTTNAQNPTLIRLPSGNVFYNCATNTVSFTANLAAGTATITNLNATTVTATGNVTANKVTATGAASAFAAGTTIGGAAVCTATAPCDSTLLTATLTTTAAATDVVFITGVTSTSKCSLDPTNSAALAATQAGITGKSTGSVTVTHATTAGMTYDILCTSN